MDLVLAILLVIYILTIVLEMISCQKQQHLIQDILDMNKKLILERGKIIDILINTKIPETNSVEALEKIQKILKGED